MSVSFFDHHHPRPEGVVPIGRAVTDMAFEVRGRDGRQVPPGIAEKSSSGANTWRVVIGTTARPRLVPLNPRATDRSAPTNRRSRTCE
jgi:hypothetical protein